MVAFAIETGLRRGEQFNLRWEHVSMEAGVLTIPLPKGGRTRHVPLSNGARSSFARWILLRPHPGCFQELLICCSRWTAEHFYAELSSPL